MHRIQLRCALAATCALTFFVASMPRSIAIAPALASTSRPTAASSVVAGGYSRSIAKREYEATDTSAGLQAPNRAHGLRTYFDGVGARVVDREDGTRELARLETIAIGREVSPAPLAAGDVHADGARVEIRRDGVVEWFENSERGLEQGWTLDERPAGAGALVVDVAFGAEIRLDGAEATIVAGSRMLEYGGLVASDAEGRTLAAHMENGDGDDRLRIVVDDGGAAYPITIDPGLTSPAFATLSSAEMGSYYGCSVAGAGDVNGDGYDDVLVGAQYYDGGGLEKGAAFVYLGGPAGVASGGVPTAATALVSDQDSSLFGESVAGAGDVNGDGYDDVIVGAPFYQVTKFREGAAFVFLGGPNGLASGGPSSASAVLRSDQANGILGWSVAGAGDVNGDGFDDVVTGGPSYDAGQTDEGAAFVFLGGPAGVASATPATANAILQADVANANYGWSCDGAGDVNGDGFDDVIVGAVDYTGPEASEGAAFVYVGGPGGTSTAASTSLQGNQTQAKLGVSVAGAGDTNGDGFDDVLVGASGYNGGLGAAFVFRGGTGGVASGGPALAATTLTATVSGSVFGSSVAFADLNRDGYADVVVGAGGLDSPQVLEGGVYVYLGSPLGVPNGTAATADVALESDQQGANFGISVAGAGDTNGDGFGDIVVGARNFDTLQSDAGAAFVYRGASDGVNGFPPARTTVQSNQGGMGLGYSVAGLGDTNGDGFDDMIVGAPYYDNGASDTGAAFVFLGGPNGVASGNPNGAAATLLGDTDSALFGYTVARAGDVNGDGYVDVLVTAPNYADDLLYEGAAYIFLGGPAGIASGAPSTAATKIEGDKEFSSFGISGAGAGDVDGDGYDDVIVGTPIDPTSISSIGAVYVFRGGPGGIASGGIASASTTLGGQRVAATFGNSVAGAGDVNGDGYDDIVVGAHEYEDGALETGFAFVFMGGPSGIPNGGPSTARTVLRGRQEPADFGVSVAGAGDVNNDGYDDIIVGADTFAAGQTGEGAAFIFLGGPGGGVGQDTATAATVLQGDLANAQFGAAVSGAGDVNGDGYDDVVVGAPSYDGATGAAFVFLGGPGRGVANGVPATAAVFMRGSAAPHFGGAVAGVGDVNHDGFADFAVGTAYIAPADGALYVYSRPRAANAKDTPGVYAAGTGTFFLRNTNTAGRADVAFGFGAGNAGYVAISGDWDANGVDTPGLYDPASGTFFLTNDNTPGPAQMAFRFGAGGPGRIPLSGDWDGDGVDTVGLYDTATGTFFLTNTNSPGPADVTFSFGAAGGVPVSGDWNGDRTDTVGVYVPATGAFFLRNLNASGPADVAFTYGPAGSGWTPLSGDFDGDGVDTVALFDPTTATFYLRNGNAGGAADLAFAYGAPGASPLVGDWNGK